MCAEYNLFSAHKSLNLVHRESEINEYLCCVNYAVISTVASVKTGSSHVSKNLIYSRVSPHDGVCGHPERDESL